MLPSPPSGQGPISLEYQIYLPANDTLVTGMVKTSVLYGGQQSTIIYTSVGGRSRKNSAPTGSGGGGEVITGNKVLKPVAWDQLGSAWILAQYAPTTPFTCCTDVETGNPVYGFQVTGFLKDFSALATASSHSAMQDLLHNMC